VTNLEVDYVDRKGKVTPIEINATVAQTAQGVQVVTLCRDITERRTLTDELGQARKLEAIGRLAAGIAHEINTPTQFVGDNTRFLQQAFVDLCAIVQQFKTIVEAADCPLPEDRRARAIEALHKADVDYLVEEVPKAIEQSLEGLSRVGRIVGAMKEFSHPSTQTKQLVDLNRAIETTITVSRNEWKYVADVVTDFDANLPPVPCLPGDFNQAILNILINATHAIADAVGKDGGRKGTITITTRADGDWAEVRISDTGTGIPENIRQNIFEPFFTTKEVGRGTGQGLSIARSVVVEKHGGTLTFETEVGKGTTFIIRLPLTEPQVQKEEP
jgi:signal transduction histidine kinase